MSSPTTITITTTTTTSRVLDQKVSERLLSDFLRRRENKKCCDCNKPAPNFVNLSIGSFVCLECSGLLREFEFRTKSVTLSTFTSEEISQFEKKVGASNVRANEIWLGKHPEREKATPGPDNTDVLRRFLAKKYREKAWYDAAAAAAKPIEMISSDVSSLQGGGGLSSSNGSGGGSGWSPQTTGRKRVGSASSTGGGGGAGTSSGAAEHRNFVASTHARAAAQASAAAAAAASAAADQEDDNDDGDDNDDDGGDDDGGGVGDDPVAKERQRRLRIRNQIESFYRIHNVEKLDSIDAFVDWVMYHGMPAFNKKLREKYGTDIELSGHAKKSPNLKNRKGTGGGGGEKKILQARFSRSKSIMNPDVDISRLESAAKEMSLIDFSDVTTKSTNPFDVSGVPSSSSSTSNTNNKTTMVGASSSSNPFDTL
jgi:hypothetical protein